MTCVVIDWQPNFCRFSEALDRAEEVIKRAAICREPVIFLELPRKHGFRGPETAHTYSRLYNAARGTPWVMMKKHQSDGSREVMHACKQLAMPTDRFTLIGGYAHGSSPRGSNGCLYETLLGLKRRTMLTRSQFEIVTSACFMSSIGPENFASVQEDWQPYQRLSRVKLLELNQACQQSAQLLTFDQVEVPEYVESLTLGSA